MKNRIRFFEKYKIHEYLIVLILKFLYSLLSCRVI